VTYNLVRSSPYQRAKKDLSDPALLHLRIAELLIADSPEEAPGRELVWLGRRMVWLSRNGDLAIWFQVPDDKTVELVLVVDTTDVPDWFLESRGTWYETFLLEET
jgi:hypothetical protein